MDHDKVEKAAKLLAKAQSTEYDAEATALVEKSCRILTGAITSLDAKTRPAGRRVGTFGGVGLGRGPAITYCSLAKELRPKGIGHIDMTA